MNREEFAKKFPWLHGLIDSAETDLHELIDERTPDRQLWSAELEARYHHLAELNEVRKLFDEGEISLEDLQDIQAENYSWSDEEIHDERERQRTLEQAKADTSKVLQGLPTTRKGD